MKYPEIRDGEWIRPRMRKWRMICCDCGLAHDVDFRVTKGGVELRVARNERSTAARRRKKP